MSHLTLRVLHGTPVGAQSVLAQAEAEGMLRARGQMTVLVTNLLRSSDRDELTDSVDLNAVLSELVVAASARGDFVVGVDRNAIVMIAKAPTDRDHASIIAAIRSSARRCDLAVRGIGVAVVDSDLMIGSAYRRAKFTCALAPQLARTSGVATWESLGLWSALISVPWSIEGVAQISKPAVELIGQKNASMWQTVLEYFNNGQDVVKTCDALSIHRATLYYRLDRARLAIGANTFSDGWLQTSLHVGLMFFATVDSSIHQDRALLTTP